MASCIFVMQLAMPDPVGFRDASHCTRKSTVGSTLHTDSLNPHPTQTFTARIGLDRIWKGDGVHGVHRKVWSVVPSSRCSRAKSRRGRLTRAC